MTQTTEVETMANSRATAKIEPSWDESMRLIEDLHGMSSGARVEAFERLVRDSSPGIRTQALRIGAAILSDERLADYLRDDADAVLRNAGLEILKLRGSRAFSLAVELLEDPDPDVVLQAALILDHLKDPRALEALRNVLDHPDVNVVQAAILAIGHLGDSRAVADLIPFVEGDPWLQMAAVEALGDLRSPKAAPALAALLADLMLGSLAADSLARIGGAQCYRILALHWLRFEADLDAETLLGLLAHVMEGLPKLPSGPDGLRSSLARRLDDSNESVRNAAARCLLTQGPGPEDTRCLDLLAEVGRDRATLPPCLRLREDLVGDLLTRSGRLQGWGFLLAARFPSTAPAELLTRALDELVGSRLLSAVVKGLSQVQDPALDRPIVDLYARLPLAERLLLSPVLDSRKSRLRTYVAEHPGMGPGTRLVLVAIAGEDAEAVANEVEALAPDKRVEIASQLFERDDVLRLLPWKKWLAEEPERYVRLAADVAMRTEMRNLVPVLRTLMETNPVPEVIRALGHLGSRESVPALVDILDRRPDLGPLVLESLGEIGGEKARTELRKATGGEDAAVIRLAYRALSLCATEKDEALFLAAIAHADWNVRLACTEVLGRSSRVEHLAALSHLVADPVAIVSQRAASFLES